VSCIKGNIQELYSLDLNDEGDDLNREDIAKKVVYLLDRDRFVCDPVFYEVC